MQTNVISNSANSVNPLVINPSVNTEKVSETKVEKTATKTKETKPKSAPKKETVAKTATPKKTAPKTATKTAAGAIVQSKTAALKSLREANKEVRTISGVIKVIRSFWNNGYKEAFKFLDMKFEDIEYKNIVSLWAKALKEEDGTLLYVSKVARVAKTEKDGTKVYEMKDGKKVFDLVKKPYNNNFTVLKMFDALLTGKIERKEIVL